MSEDHLGRAATAPAAIVTGGSEGIGLAIAHRLAAGGHRLLLIARDQGRLEAAARAIEQRVGRPADVLALDLTRADSIAAIDAWLAARQLHVDLLVNSAGIGLSGEFSDLGPDAIEALLALNVGALTRLMRHYLPGMRARRSGGILNVASLGGYVPGPYQAVYYASKTYVISLSEAVAAEVSGDGVRVTVVAPGPVATRFHAKMRAESAFYRRLVPAASPASVAFWSLLAHRCRLRTVAPGVLDSLLLLCLRLLPHRVVVPIVAWLLRPRGRGAGDA